MGFVDRKPLAGLDVVRLNSVRLTQWLQQMSGLHSSNSSEVFRSLSYMTDTWFIYFWIYPICTLVHPLLGFQVLFALLGSEWTAVVLKCIFPDDRPYWWFPGTEYSSKGAHETAIYEFPETCETTSGFPSSHSMLFAACSIVVLLHFRDRMKKVNPQSTKRVWNAINSLLIPTFLSLNFLGMVGRIFTTTNFHYQSFAGFLLGSCIGAFAYWKTTKLFAFDKKKAGILLRVVFGSLVLFTFGFLITAWDPFWSVSVAVKWCWNTHNFMKEVKKSIFYYALRVAGIATGFTISNNMAGIWLRMGSTATMREKVLLGILYFAEIQFWTKMEAIGVDFQILVYASTTFVTSILHVLLITTFLPILVTKLNWLMRVPQEDDKERLTNVLGSFANPNYDIDTSAVLSNDEA